MKKYVNDRGIVYGDSKPATMSLREMLNIRTHELAMNAGRSKFKITQIDYEQAKRELTGEVETDRQNAVLDYEMAYPNRALNVDNMSVQQIPTIGNS